MGMGRTEDKREHTYLHRLGGGRQVIQEDDVLKIDTDAREQGGGVLTKHKVSPLNGKQGQHIYGHQRIG